MLVITRGYFTNTTPTTVFEATKRHDYWFETFDLRSLVIGSGMEMVMLSAYQGLI